MSSPQVAPQPLWYGYPPKRWPPPSEAGAGWGAEVESVQGEPDRPYLQAFRISTYRGWRPLAGMSLFAATAFAASLALLVVPLLVLGLGDLDSDEALASPEVLLFTNLSLAVLIPCALFAAWAAHRVRPGIVSSVVGRIRWKWLAAFSGIALGVTLVTYGLSAFLPTHAASEAEPVPEFVGWSTYLPLVLVIVLTTPLQAAGEEYAFRGYLSQAIGAWARTWTWVPVLVTSLLFALAHGQQDPALFTDRFMFGVALAVLTIRTGGLEAGIALHAANNLVILLVGASFDDLAETLTSTQASWSVVGVDAFQLVLYGAIVLAVGRRMQRTTRPAALVRSGTTVTTW